MTKDKYINRVNELNVIIEERNKKIKEQDKKLEELIRKNIASSKKLTREVIPFHEEMYKISSGYREVIERIERDFGNFYDLIEEE